MLKLKDYFDIKWLVLAVTFTAIVILLTHIPQRLVPSRLQESGLDKFLHVAAYGAITFLLILSVKSMFSLRSALLVLFVLSAIGAADEITQSLVGRQTSFADLVADVIGIVAVLSLSIVGKHQLRKTKTEPISQFCFTAATAFIAGVLVVPVASISLSILTGPSLFQRQQAARYFFYSTMCELFEGGYDPEEGSISENALETFREYRPRLGDKCSLSICNYPYNLSRQKVGYFDGAAFFPSGDSFQVLIVRTGSRFVIERFEHWDWDTIWSEVLSDAERYYRLGYSPVYYEP
jgi:VanZ family protein